MNSMSEESFESFFSIGDPVFVTDGENKFTGNIRTVTFTAGKVRYSVSVNYGGEENSMTLHNIDSVAVVPNPDGKKVKMPFDNYS